MAIEKLKEKEAKVETVESIPTTLPVLPLRDVVIFPYMIFPVLVGRESSLRAANFALEGDKYIFLAAQQDPSIDDPGADDIYKEGVIAKIIQILKLPNGLLKILVDGTVQATVKKYVPNEKFLQAEIEIHAVVPEKNAEMEAIVRHASTLFSEYVRANRTIPPEADRKSVV